MAKSKSNTKKKEPVHKPVKKDLPAGYKKVETGGKFWKPLEEDTLIAVYTGKKEEKKGKFKGINYFFTRKSDGSPVIVGGSYEISTAIEANGKGEYCFQYLETIRLKGRQTMNRFNIGFKK